MKTKLIKIEEFPLYMESFNCLYWMPSLDNKFFNDTYRRRNIDLTIDNPHPLSSISLMLKEAINED